MSDWFSPALWVFLLCDGVFGHFLDHNHITLPSKCSRRRVSTCPHIRELKPRVGKDFPENLPRRRKNWPSVPTMARDCPLFWIFQLSNSGQAFLHEQTDSARVDSLPRSHRQCTLDPRGAPLHTVSYNTNHHGRTQLCLVCTFPMPGQSPVQ